jgi:OmpA-OmpF porin, OOP family
MFKKEFLALLGILLSLSSPAKSFSSNKQPFYQKDSIVIEGIVFDSETKKPLKARISYEKIPTRDDIGISYSDSITGAYQLILKDSSRYKVTIQANNFITSYEMIEIIDGKFSERLIEIYLVPLKIGQVIVMNKIEFERGKDILLPESFSELDNVYKMLSEHSKMAIQLEGHTDNSGSSDANLKLSEKRVNAVRSYLVEKGIKKGRIEVKAYGGAKPVASNATEEGRVKNRRVEIRILRN